MGINNSIWKANQYYVEMDSWKNGFEDINSNYFLSKISEKSRLKGLRVNYDGIFINRFHKDCLLNLFTIYPKASNEIKKLSISAFESITYLMDNYKTVKEIDEVHSDLVENLEDYWNTRKIPNFKYKYNNATKLLIEALEKNWNIKDNRGMVISIIRIPEYYYLSHGELEKIQNDPLNNLNYVPMLNKDKSIFQVEGKDKLIEEIMMANKDFIEKHYKYDEKFPVFVRNYFSYPSLRGQQVNELITLIRAECNKEITLYEKGLSIYYHSKDSSGFYPGSDSAIEDSFYSYDSDIVDQNMLARLVDYETIKMTQNFDYLKLGFGLGPDYKVRNIVFTNSQNNIPGSILHSACKRAIEIYESNMESRGFPHQCNMRTYSQNAKFSQMINNKSWRKYKICFDLSKYSDYMIVQLLKEIVDLVMPDKEIAESMKKVLSLPIKVGEKFLPILFGSGQGVKGNFDLITLANMIMVDIAASYAGIIYDNMNTVGDDLYVDSDDERFEHYIKMSYTHFNCLINMKKSNSVKERGRISFCNRHYWIENNDYHSWNGLPPGLWMKEIYSFNRLNTIASMMISTHQKDDLNFIDDLFENNKDNIDRELKINNVKRTPDDIYKEIKNIPLDLNGLMLYNYEEFFSQEPDWVAQVYNNLESYRFQLTKNKNVNNVFHTYFDIFTSHPILDSLLMNNIEYVKCLTRLNYAHKNIQTNCNKITIRAFKDAVRSTQNVLSKMDKDVKRISTKDRTSDYFFEDKFFRNKDEIIKPVISHYTTLELTILESIVTDFPDITEGSAELYSLLVSGPNIRNGRCSMYNPIKSVLFDTEDGNKIIKLVSEDHRAKNGKYEVWNYSNDNIDIIWRSAYGIDNELPFNDRYDIIKGTVNIMEAMCHRNKELKNNLIQTMITEFKRSEGIID